MASLQLRRCFSLSKPLISPFLHSFCSSSSPIKPVSYPVKPKDQEHPPPPPQQPPTLEPQQQQNPTWSREDARFVKDGPSIKPVSYPARVAPLPEDRVAEEEVKEEEVKEEGDGEVRMEGARIETGSRVRSYVGVEEEKPVPFPTLVKKEKKAQKVVLELSEAIREVKANAANARRNFIETVEAHVNLGVNPRRGDQMVRGAITLPHGTGKTVRVAVFAEGDSADAARAAGADVVGGDELIEKIKDGKGKLDFDKCIATPMYMPRLGKIAKILGPRGLMPNPKLGSVTSNVSEAVKAAKGGRIDFKIDKTAIVHVGLGKVNFSEEVLRENIAAFVNALLLAKPVGLKKTSKYAGYVKNFTLSSTMGPGLPVSIQSLSVAADNYSKLQVK